MKVKAQKLLVVSDSHGDWPSLARVLAWAKKQDIRQIAFLGDGIADLSYAMDRATYYPAITAVRGNNDWGAREPDIATLEFAEKKFLLVHGHRHNVSSSYSGLLYIAQEMGADAILHGHTHRMFFEDIKGRLILCPGSSSRPRGSGPAGFATIDCQPDRWFSPHFWSLEAGAIREHFLGTY